MRLLNAMNALEPLHFSLLKINVSKTWPPRGSQSGKSGKSGKAMSRVDDYREYTVPSPRHPMPMQSTDVSAGTQSFTPLLSPLAVISRSFCSAVRNNLCRTIDLRTIPSTARIEQPNAILASRWDLAETVHTLICDRWPTSSSKNTITPFSLS
jgi:hypothetical protein